MPRRTENRQCPLPGSSALRCTHLALPLLLLLLHRLPHPGQFRAMTSALCQTILWMFFVVGFGVLLRRYRAEWFFRPSLHLALASEAEEKHAGTTGSGMVVAALLATCTPVVDM